MASSVGATTMAGNGAGDGNPSSSSSQVFLHPVVMVNMSDQVTRYRSQLKQAGTSKDAGARLTVPVIGALLGRQQGREFEIMTSYELLVEADGNGAGGYAIDKEYFTAKQEQFRQVAADMEFLGWYAVRADAEAETSQELDIHLHKQFLEFNENLLYLRLHLSAEQKSTELPLHVYEAHVDYGRSGPGDVDVRFSVIPYELQMEASERIAVDHIMSTSLMEAASGDKAINSSPVYNHLSSLHNTVSMFHQQLQKLVKALSSGTPMTQDQKRKLQTLLSYGPKKSGSMHEKLVKDLDNTLMIMGIHEIGVNTKQFIQTLDKNTLRSSKSSSAMPLMP